MDECSKFTLIIDFKNASVEDLHDILGILYGGSTLCVDDIILMASETIDRLDIIGNGIRKIKHRRFIYFVHRLYAVLRKLNLHTEMSNIQERYRQYSKRRDLTPVSTPGPTQNDSPPKIMKKAKRFPRTLIPSIN